MCCMQMTSAVQGAVAQASDAAAKGAQEGKGQGIGQGNWAMLSSSFKQRISWNKLVESAKAGDTPTGKQGCSSDVAADSREKKQD